MTANEKKEIKNTVSEDTKKEKKELGNFQRIYDNIITEVTKAGEKK